MQKHNTRVAPSPTGHMHLGTARTAYFNWLAAKSSGGKFILRIDDTDYKRNDQSHTDLILETFDWLGLDYDDIVYQSDRFHQYKQTAANLVDLKLAEILDNGAIALSKDSSVMDLMPDTWKDGVAGDIPVTDHDRKVAKGSILIKGDGTPAYNFATAHDDYFMDVNHVIRGHDHISNTPKQLLMMNVLESFVNGGTIPQYTHVGLIHFKKKKLSKRDGASSLLKYKEDGIHPEAILNFMLRLGWSERDGKTIKKIPKDLAVDIFWEKGKLRNQSASMDLNHLSSMAKKYKN